MYISRYYKPGSDSCNDGICEMAISVGGGGIAEAGGGGGGGTDNKASASSGLKSSENSGIFLNEGAIPGPKSVM